VLEPGGIRNLSPRAGEPAFIPDQPSGVSEAAEETHALISHVPGLYGNGDILYLSGNQISSTLAAVRALTDPTLARALISKLKSPDGTPAALLSDGVARAVHGQHARSKFRTCSIAICRRTASPHNQRSADPNRFLYVPCDTV
jgi:hypothetical protein